MANALTGFVELKAPGKGADPRGFANLHDKEQGKKLVFDDDGNAHELYELEDEDKFKERGSADTQKLQFLEAEQERLQAVDLEDKALAKAKRKEKREKKKAREEGEEELEKEAREPVLATPDEKVGKDLDQMEWSDEEVEPEDPPSKRPKKWFEEDSDGEPNGKRHKKVKTSSLHGLETLESLESVAAGLLD